MTTTQKNWAGLAVLALPSLLIALDVNALFLALPALSTDLHLGGAAQLWVIDIYGFLQAGFLITMGNLGDRIGRRRLLLIGVAAFGLTSIAAAYATSPAQLIAGRALMGVAAATLMPSTLALISNMFADDRQRGTAVAIWATSTFAGAAFGPVVTGLLLEHFWWGSVFLLNVPIMAGLLVAGPLLLPEFRNPDPGRLDPTSVALSLVAVLLFVYGLKQVGTGDLSPVPVAAIAVGVAGGIVFVRRQLRLDHPLLDLNLFRRRAFTAALICLAFSSASLAGTGLVITQYLQSVLGNPPARAALLFSPVASALAVSSMLSPVLVRKVKPGNAIATGLAAATGGFLLLAAGWVMTGAVVVALGTGPLVALGVGLVLAAVPRERAGAAASLSETANALGGTFGIALLGTVVAAVYQYRMAPADGPARQTLAGAVATHDPALLGLARTAYTHGMGVAAVLCALVFAGLALLVTQSFREPASQPPQSDKKPFSATSQPLGDR